LLKDNPDPGSGVWRFETKLWLQNQMDIRYKKFYGSVSGFRE